jgi:hypothetical protein
MANKLGRGILPKGHSVEDFECFGPPATVDGSFSSTKLADLGCFTQDGKDSNKFYHAAVVRSKKNNQWFAYFEWGRTGSSKADFNFIECSSETEAQSEYESQLHSKNDKRGEWKNIGGKQILQAKAGKDCYLVRPLATRSTGLPDAKKIAFNDSSKKVNLPAKNVVASSHSKPKWDPHTLKLMKDMNVATISYARTSIVGGSIPTQSALDEAREILIEAEKRIVKIGDDLKDQIRDNDLKQLTYTLYSRVPKVKKVGADDEEWILSGRNISNWRLEIDAFESALYAIDTDSDKNEDPLAGFNIEMEWLDPNSENGKFILNWMPKASRNRHSDLRNGMKIHNVWSVCQLNAVDSFRKAVKKIADEKPRISERALHQPKSRNDVESELVSHYEEANVSMLFHGTRSVNVPGILRENLRLPKQLVGVVITGAMFGGGIYWADDWKKSAGYTSGNSRWGGGDGSVKGRHSFMFVADTALGNPHVAPGPRGYTEPPKGHHCVFGKADKSGVMNNEFITFSTSQHKLRYLVEFST